jgi:hypothetical protein
MSAKKENPSGRDQNGRFTHGNPGGPGNPYARQIAQLRQAALSVLTPEKMKDLIEMVYMYALQGDMVAVRFLFQWVIGKPCQSCHPDRLDQDEWTVLRPSLIHCDHLSEARGVANLPLRYVNYCAKEAIDRREGQFSEVYDIVAESTRARKEHEEKQAKGTIPADQKYVDDPKLAKRIVELIQEMIKPDNPWPLVSPMEPPPMPEQPPTVNKRGGTGQQAANRRR